MACSHINQRVIDKTMSISTTIDSNLADVVYQNNLKKQALTSDSMFLHNTQVEQDEILKILSIKYSPDP